MNKLNLRTFRPNKCLFVCGFSNYQELFHRAMVYVPRKHMVSKTVLKKKATKKQSYHITHNIISYQIIVNENAQIKSNPGGKQVITVRQTRSNRIDFQETCVPFLLFVTCFVSLTCIFGREVFWDVRLDSFCGCGLYFVGCEGL